MVHCLPTKYAERIIKRLRIEDVNTVAIPADQYQDLSLRDPENDKKAINVPCKEAVGSLLYLAIVMRPDIAYVVNAVSQYAESPSKQHWDAVKRIIKYIKETIDYGIKFKRTESNLSLVAFSDADFAGNKQTRKSTSGLVIKLGNALIVWGSEKQRSVALSTTESEYIAASQTTKELIWVSRLMKDLIKTKMGIPKMYIDNQSAIRLVKNPEFHKRSKHIDLSYHFVRQYYEEKLFELYYVDTKEQIADICTKPLNKMQFQKLREMLGVTKEIN